MNNNKVRKGSPLIGELTRLYNEHRRTGESTYTRFLNESEVKDAERYLQSKGISYHVKKVNSLCEKSIIYFGEYEDFISIFYIRNKKIRHKDVLGSLFIMGYKHYMLGDVLIKDGVYLTNLKRYDPLIEGSFTQVGKYRIQLERVDAIPEFEREMEKHTFHFTSFRLDFIISKLAKINIEDVPDFMRKNFIYVNYNKTEKCDLRLELGDIVSIGQVGKFKVTDTTRINKKGNVTITLEEY